MKMKLLAFGVGVMALQGACGSTNVPDDTTPNITGTATTGPTADTTTGVGTGSEVATSAVSGAMNNSAGSAVAWNFPVKVKDSLLNRVLDTLNPVATAWGFTISCTGGARDLSPAFDGSTNNPYTFTPRSCTIGWRNGKSTSSVWSSTFTLNYGSSCDDTHEALENQAAGCTLTRLTDPNGNTRTITGEDGNTYAVTHNTNGAGTEWDASANSPETNDGLIRTCDATGGCAAGQTLAISGSHLTAVVNGTKTVWDHTVYTSPNSPLVITGTGTSRTVSGVVTVEHNLAKFTSTTDFNSVVYGDAACCFPTSGSVTTTFTNGTNVGKTETMTFSSTCGEETLTKTDGTTAAFTLQHCL